jgi:hypothetical protein
MKYTAVLATTLILLARAVYAEEHTAVPSISVSGTVATKVMPDRIVWSISLTDTDPDMRAAKAANDAKVDAVLALREPLGLGDGNIEAGTIRINREYHRDENGHQGAFKHFVVRRHVTIRQRDLSRFDEYLDKLVASTEMEVNFNFESSKVHEIRKETRLEALKIAKQKAQDMAEVAGAKLGPVLAIDEGSRDRRHIGISNNSIQMERGGVPAIDQGSERFIPGAISIRMTVYASFQLL